MREEVFEGKSEEEALLRASEVLGVNISDMQYEVLEHETGLFGLFRKSVKVRVRVPDEVQGIVYRDPAARPNHAATARRADLARTVAEDAGSDDEAPESAGAVEGALVRKGPDAEAALRGILDRMGVEAQVTCEEDGEAIRLNIATGERDLVIGRDGEVLSALQFVLNKIVNRSPEGRKRVVLDAEGFRGRRAEELTRMAERLADKAVRTGRVIRLAAMNAQDRRVVHMALKDRPGLTTHSEGEGLFRCLMIVPTEAARGDRAGTGRRSGGRRGPRPRPGEGRGPSA